MVVSLLIIGIPAGLAAVALVCYLAGFGWTKGAIDGARYTTKWRNRNVE